MCRVGEGICECRVSPACHGRLTGRPSLSSSCATECYKSRTIALTSPRKTRYATARRFFVHPIRVLHSPSPAAHVITLQQPNQAHYLRNIARICPLASIQQTELMQDNGIFWDGALGVEIWILDAGGCLRFCQVEGAKGGYVTEDLSPVGLLRLSPP